MIALYFRPSATSYASMTTRTFSRPATMRNVMPYSYVTARTSPMPKPSGDARKYSQRRSRIARSASRQTSGSEKSNGKIRPWSARPIANISGSATRKTRPFERRPEPEMAERRESPTPRDTGEPGRPVAFVRAVPRAHACASLPSRSPTPRPTPSGTPASARIQCGGRDPRRPFEDERRRRGDEAPPAERFVARPP